MVSINNTEYKKDIEVLNLSCQIIEIPKEIGNLQQLRILDLKHNLFAEIPKKNR
ncbi:hypothetical protein Hokovirus_1_333 [Hokovirus HKV1]|uniref:Leucine rich repeat protein n=1 Tax=Hokovirus HKV1 TaxID=1977638 RepID=A0A1V0SFN5_9VIRU|nr:hypothetical protein Hokovirus_1_333 [Hokovirus HKV1]